MINLYFYKAFDRSKLKRWNKYRSHNICRRRRLDNMPLDIQINIFIITNNQSHWCLLIVVFCKTKQIFALDIFKSKEKFYVSAAYFNSILWNKKKSLTCWNQRIIIIRLKTITNGF